MARPRSSETSGEDSTISIADQVATTLTYFRNLQAFSNGNVKDDYGAAGGPRFNTFAESFGRFRIWCGNIAAHRRDKTSLDYRLRDSPYIRSGIVKLLQDLDELLLEGKGQMLCSIKPHSVGLCLVF